jgi:hypothetical protein
MGDWAKPRTRGADFHTNDGPGDLNLQCGLDYKVSVNARSLPQLARQAAASVWVYYSADAILLSCIAKCAYSKKLSSGSMRDGRLSGGILL